MYIHNDELDQLLQEVQLKEPDWYGGNGINNNNATIMNLSQVQLFLAVGSPTDKPLQGRIQENAKGGADFIN